MYLTSVFNSDLSKQISHFLYHLVIVSSNVIVNSRAFLSRALGSGDWAATPYVNDSR